MFVSPEILFQSASNDDAVDEALSEAAVASLNLDSIAFWHARTLADLNLSLAPLFVFGTSDNIIAIWSDKLLEVLDWFAAA